MLHLIILVWLPSGNTIFKVIEISLWGRKRNKAKTTAIFFLQCFHMLLSYFIERLLATFWPAMFFGTHFSFLWVINTPLFSIHPFLKLQHLSCLFYLGVQAVGQQTGHLASLSPLCHSNFIHLQTFCIGKICLDHSSVTIIIIPKVWTWVTQVEPCNNKGQSVYISQLAWERNGDPKGWCGENELVSSCVSCSAVSPGPPDKEKVFW